MPTDDSNTGRVKTVGKNALYMYMRTFLITIVSLYTTRVVIDALGIQSFGLYSAVSGLVILIQSLSLSLSTASQRFLSYSIALNSKNEIREDYWSVLFIFILFSCFILILAETLGLWFVANKLTIPPDRHNSVLIIFQITLLSSLVHFMTTPFLSLLISHEDVSFYAYTSLIEAGLKLLVAFLIKTATLYDKLVLYSILLLLVSIIVYVIYFLVCKRRYSQILAFSERPRLHIYKLKSIFSFSSWTFIGGIAGTANTQGVNLLLNMFFGTIANAAYAVSVQINVAIQLISNNLFLALRPAIIKSYAREDHSFTRRLFYLSNNVCLILLLTICIPLWLEVPSVLKIWVGSVEEYMISFSRLFIVYSILLALSNPFTIIVQACNEVKKYHLIVDGFALLSLPISYILLKNGAPAEIPLICVVFIMMVANFIRLWYVARIYPEIKVSDFLLAFLIPSSFYITLSFVTCYFISHWVSQTPPYTSIALVALFSLIFTSLLGFRLLLKKSERRTILKFISANRFFAH